MAKQRKAPKAPKAPRATGIDVVPANPQAGPIPAAAAAAARGAARQAIDVAGGGELAGVVMRAQAVQFSGVTLEDVTLTFKARPGELGKLADAGARLANLLVGAQGGQG